MRSGWGVRAKAHSVCMQHGHKALTSWSGEGGTWRFGRNGSVGTWLPGGEPGRGDPRGAGLEEALGSVTTGTDSLPGPEHLSWIQAGISGSHQWRAEDGLPSLRGKQLCSGQPTRVKHRPGESGAFSRTIIGDFFPKPDIGSITKIHREGEFYIRRTFQSYYWPSAGELCFQSQRRQTILKEQELSVTQQGRQGPAKASTLPASAQGHAWTSDSGHPHSAPQLPGELREHPVLILGCPWLAIQTLHGGDVHTFRLVHVPLPRYLAPGHTFGDHRPPVAHIPCQPSVVCLLPVPPPQAGMAKLSNQKEH